MNRRLFKDQPTIMRTLRAPNQRWIECVARLVPIGVQVEIISDSWSIYSRIFPTGDEAFVFAEEERAVWASPQG